MREIIKLGIVLLIVAVVAATALSITNDLTIDQIIAQRNLINEEARRNILTTAESFELLDQSKMQEITNSNENIVEVYTGYSGDTVVGYTIKSLSSGYGGTLEVMTGINNEGIVTGVRVGNHQETPGLGANATLPSFYGQYENKSTENSLEVVKNPPSKENEIQAISGATITSKAVTTGVNYAIDVFKNVLVK